jgi:hypothetical protein
MKIYDKQSLKQVYEVETQALTENIQAMEKSIEVIQRFDGKVLNVRLKKAIDEVIPGFVSIEVKSYNQDQATIEFYANNRYITTEPDKNGVYSTIYSSIYDRIVIWDLPLVDNRIQAEAWIEKIKTSIESHKNQLETMYINNNDKVIDELQTEYDQLLKSIIDFNDKQDYVNNKMFRIDYRI